MKIILRLLIVMMSSNVYASWLELRLDGTEGRQLEKKYHTVESFWSDHKNLINTLMDAMDQKDKILSPDANDALKKLNRSNSELVRQAQKDPIGFFNDLENLIRYVEENTILLNQYNIDQNLFLTELDLIQFVLLKSFKK